MTGTLSHLIAEYGYFAIIIGCFFEGEIVILLGILAAHDGLLAAHYVWLAGMFGTILGDNAWFLAGHKMGRMALARRPKWWVKAARVEDMLKRYGILVILGYRFLYAMRSITPFALGTLNFSFWRFFSYDTLGTAVWTAVITVMGVYLVGAIHRMIDHIHSLEQALLVAFLVVILVGGFIYYLRWRNRNKD